MDLTMPAQNFISDKDLGYAQFAAGAVDASTLVSTATFGGKPAGIPIGTQTLLIVPEAQAIRWRSDGIAPTTTVGYPLAVGSELRFTIAQIPQLRIISQTAGAIVNMYALGSAGQSS